MKYLKTYESFLFEIKEKEPLIRLFSNKDILDNGVLKNLLIHYVESQHNLDPGEFEKFVQSLMDSKGKYTGLQPKRGYAYRGSSVAPSNFEEMKMNKIGEKGGYSIFKQSYTSVNAAQSWTYDIKVAQRFADKGLFNNPRLEKGGRPAILRATIDDSFVGSPELIKPISSMLSLKDEKEIFHLGNTVSDCEWMIATADVEKLLTYA